MGGLVCFDEIGVKKEFVCDVFKYVYILRDCYIGLIIINEYAVFFVYYLF